MWHLDGLAGYYQDALGGEVVAHIQLFVNISQIKKNFLIELLGQKLCQYQRIYCKKKMDFA